MYIQYVRMHGSTMCYSSHTFARKSCVHVPRVRTYVVHMYVRMYVHTLVLSLTPTHTPTPIFRLRMRIKALQQVIESQNARLAELQVAGGRDGEVREDTNTGQRE